MLAIDDLVQVQQHLQIEKKLSNQLVIDNTKLILRNLSDIEHINNNNNMINNNTKDLLALHTNNYIEHETNMLNINKQSNILDSFVVINNKNNSNIPSINYVNKYNNCNNNTNIAENNQIETISDRIMNRLLRPPTI